MKRRELGLTQKELAKRLNIAVETLRNWELENTHPNLRNTPKLAQIPNRFGIYRPGDFPNDLLLARRRLGLSQAELGGRLGVSKDTIWEWEHGNHEPRPKARVAIDRFLHETLGNYEYVPVQIRALRKRLRLTQRGLAARLRVYPKTVSRWERGRRRPSEEMLERIEGLLNHLNQ
jgi:transcriptional regulator with XRE-family HTH domain